MSIITLLQPPGMCRAFTRSGSSFPPLGLCQLSASINNKKKCKVLDLDALKYTDSQALQYIKNINPFPKAFGMTLTNGTSHIIELWSKQIKAINKQTKMFIGGPQVSLDPLDTIHKCQSVDYLVKGEGETIFPELVNAIENDCFQNISEMTGVISIDNKNVVNKYDDIY